MFSENFSLTTERKMITLNEWKLIRISRQPRSHVLLRDSTFPEVKYRTGIFSLTTSYFLYWSSEQYTWRTFYGFSLSALVFHIVFHNTPLEYHSLKFLRYFSLPSEFSKQHYLYNKFKHNITIVQFHQHFLQITLIFTGLLLPLTFYLLFTKRSYPCLSLFLFACMVNLFRILLLSCLPPLDLCFSLYSERNIRLPLVPFHAQHPTIASVRSTELTS